MERLAERSAVPRDAPLLQTLDAKDDRLLRRRTTEGMIEDAGDRFLPARAEGFRAGSLNDTAPEADRNLVPTAATPLPLFSARTYLGPDQMRPRLWAKWLGDPAPPAT